MPRGMTGAFPSPKWKLLATPPYQVVEPIPSQFAIVPAKLDEWGNASFGDCVSASEAFAKACYSPEIFIPEQTVIDWARRHGVLNGATLTEVLDAMQNDGFVVGSQKYDDGPYLGVNYADDGVLCSAISKGPVKIAIASGALPSGAGNNMGWYSVGNKHDSRTDHCVELSGQGPAEWLYQQLAAVYPSVTFPSALQGKKGYLLYTWKTIGFVDHDWIMGTVDEAFLRNPTTVGVPPLPDPTPPDVDYFP